MLTGFCPLSKKLTSFFIHLSGRYLPEYLDGVIVCFQYLRAHNTQTINLLLPQLQWRAAVRLSYQSQQWACTPGTNYSATPSQGRTSSILRTVWAGSLRMARLRTVVIGGSPTQPRCTIINTRSSRSWHWSSKSLFNVTNINILSRQRKLTNCRYKEN